MKYSRNFHSLHRSPEYVSFLKLYRVDNNPMTLLMSLPGTTGYMSGKNQKQINGCILRPQSQVYSKEPSNERRETYLWSFTALVSRTFNLSGLSHTIINSSSSNMNCNLFYYNLYYKIMFLEGSQYITLSSSPQINFTN